MTKDEYRGMRNPYHLYDLFIAKVLDWKTDPDKDKKIKDVEKLFKKTNKSDPINAFFDPIGLLDSSGEYIKYPSPLYPYVEKWWDTVKKAEEDWEL